MKIKMKKLNLAIVTILMGQSITHAQEASENQTSQVELEIIEVTSRKKVESLNRTPVSVAAFSDTMIEQQGFQSIDDIARFSSGLSFSKAFGRSTERPVIRGMGNVLAGIQFGVESGAAYFIDGNYYSGDVQSLDMSDIARVEVVKGPQSALYGRNSYSGAINFITKGPDHDEFIGNVKANFAQDSERTVSAYLSAPLNDWLAASLNVRDYQVDGDERWRNTVTDELIGGEDTRSVSLVLDASPSDKLGVRFRIQNQEDRDETRPFFTTPTTENNCAPGYRSLASWAASGTDNNFQYFCGEIKNQPIALNDKADADGIPNEVPGVPVDGFLPSGSTFFGNPYDTADGTAYDGVGRDLLISSLAINYETDSGYAMSLAYGYRDNDLSTGSDGDNASVNYTFAPGQEAFFANTSRQETKDQSLEFTLSSPVGDLEWMAGAFYYDQENDSFDLTFADTKVGVFQDNSTITNKAIYASVDYQLSDKVDATLEVRWAEEDKTVTEFDPEGVVTFDADGSWNNFTPRATLNYRYDEDTIFYGILAQGVKPGGINGSAGADTGKPTYEQEEITTFELGLKSKMLSNVYATVAMYYNDVSDIQLTTPLNIPSGNVTSVATNQGEGEVLGIEIDIDAQFSDNLSGRFTYALADTKFTKGCDDFQWSLSSGGGVLTPGTTTGTDFRDDFGVTEEASCSIEGNAFPLSSKHQASAFLEYITPITGELEAFFNVDASYESRKYVQVHNLAYVPSAIIAGARMGVSGENWRVSLYARNLTDEDAPILTSRWLGIPYFTFASLNTAPEGADMGSPRAFFSAARRGRQIGVDMTYHF
ncbi:TonB-dependent receptor [Paraglaciecola arctica]|uniref:TonB-dependent receptor n=1 Tax=Paraglaciecola arctica TaxID=1128911 RepID=UPI001C070115|nr:TonB-dependent receptor [Paraglaciecola arctica]MBU3002592.1 TonB-dependent receptor [Paraglaciecola arctica]